MQATRFLSHLLRISLILAAANSFAASVEVKVAAPALLPPKPADPYFEKFDPKPAPQPAGLVLQRGDRLAICGDSITEQKMYSRIMETYLTACVPDLGVTVRQYGWGGETAPGFLRRMTNDCLRFKPSIATTCYGMNDHGYRPYEPAIGDRYKAASLAIVESFENAGTRVIQGSPGCVGVKVDAKTGQSPAGWDAAGVEAKNLNLCTLRNIGIDIAGQEKAGFADVFWPMLNAGFAARAKYNTNFAIAGRDGVHPDWAGHLVMAYAFLHAFGLDGEIGTFTVDLKSGDATASAGHQVVSAKPGSVEIKSSRYPFCALGDPDSDRSIRCGTTLVPFHQELNRLVLRAKNGAAKSYKVTWGPASKTYTAEQLEKGINLAEDFVENPFVDSFKKLDAAVAVKQAYETKQIKVIFHDLVDDKFALDPATGQLTRKSSQRNPNAAATPRPPEVIKDPELTRLAALRRPDGTFDRDQIAAETEKTRAPLVAAVKEAMAPVTHTITISAE